MQFSRFALAAIVAAVSLAIPAVAQTNTMNDAHNAMSAHSLNTVMGAQNKSNQTGSTTVTDVSGGVEVKISLKNEPAGASEPAHIHMGTCSKLNPAPWKPLSNVVDGASTTTVKGVTVADLKKSHYAVNVHKSASDLATYVSCGDL